MSNPATINPNAKTYLQFCEEQLNPALLASYQKDAASCKTTALTSVTVLSSLVAVAFATTCALAPTIFIPIIGLTGILTLTQVKKMYTSYDQKAQIAADRACQLHAVQQNYLNVADANLDKIRSLLDEKGIPFIIGMAPKDPRLTTLKPLIARHLFWEEESKTLQEKAKEKLKSAAILEKGNFKDNRDTIYALQSEALELENQALCAKVKAAFVNAVIRKSGSRANMENLGTFSEMSGQERAIALQASGNPKANPLFTFKNSQAAPILYKEAKEYTISQLAILRIYKNV